MSARRGTAAAILFATAAVLCGAWLWQTRELARKLPPFFDEVVNLQAATRLLTELEYTSDILRWRFSSWISTGPAASVPAALPIAAGLGGLPTARAVHAQFWGAAALALAVAVARRHAFTWSEAAAAGAFAWAAVLSLPYAESSVMILGEIPAVVMLGWAAFLWRGRPFLGSLLAGCAVWLGKLIVLPAAVAVIGGMLLSSPAEERLRRSWVSIAGFIAPVLAWVGLIAVRTGPGNALAWTRATFLAGAWGASGLPSGAPVPLAERFRSLEWAGYSTSIRLRLVGSVLGGAFLGVLPALRAWRSGGRRVSGPAVPMLLLAAVIVAHLGWYLLLNAKMWIRHVQPAMVIGVGLGSYALLLVFGQGRRWRGSVALPAVLLATALAFGWKIHGLTVGRPDEGAPSVCEDVFAPPCVERVTEPAARSL